jgi:tRNA A-37 threonylcarbamoyl transferase component Bud32
LKIKSIVEEKIPEGFGCRRESGKICIFNKGWGEEIGDLARAEITKGSYDFAGIEYLQGRGCPAVVPFPQGKLVVRHYYHGGCFRALTGDLFFGASRFLNEIGVLASARDLGLPVPEPAGLIISPAFGGVFRADLVSVYIPDTFEFLTYFREFPRDPSREQIIEKRRCIAGAGRAIADLHRAGFHHADLQLKNISVQKNPNGPRVFILDFDKAREEGSTRENTTFSNLLRLYRSFGKMRLRNPHISIYDPIRFLRSYAPDDKGFRKKIFHQVRRRRWQGKFRLLKWKITLRLRGSHYARRMS